MKKIISTLVYFTFILLPWHALLVTISQCKFGLDVSLFRFWKEGMVIVFLLTGIVFSFLSNKQDFYKILKSNSVVWLIILYIVFCLVYVFYPHFSPESPSFLGFRYDVFFFLAFLSGYILNVQQKNLATILRAVFWTTIIVVIVFLGWYMFFDISTTTFLGLSSQPSVFDPHGCLSFSQNVDGHHRLQATFGGPIRYSVYLVVVYFLLLGAFLDSKVKAARKYSIIIFGTFLVLVSIFFSYSKTSYIGFLFGAIVFLVLVWRCFFQKRIPRKYLGYTIVVMLFVALIGAYAYRDLFLHLGSVVQRFENIIFSLELLRENIFGYGLGIAGPASVVAENSHYFASFLPENWYIQVWLETGVFGLFIFLSILWILGKKMYISLFQEKKYYSIGIFCAFLCLCVMALFTHSFEESATSYLLFFLIGIQLKNLDK